MQRQLVANNMIRATLGLFIVLCPLAAIAAEQMEAPKEMVVLTVGGAVGHTNRGPIDVKRDEFLAHLQISFTRAFAFDRPMLARLKQGTGPGVADESSGARSFSGPLLKEVLAAAGASTHLTKVTFRGIDGFLVELSDQDIEDGDWILALAADGQPLGLGQQGPLWLRNSPPKDRAPTVVEMERWAWGVFYMQVED
jgi:hypothetical protein